jgi:hypothetical protein
VRCFTWVGSGLKPFTSVIYESLQYARVFVPWNPLKPNLMFVSKAGGYLSEAPSLTLG